MSDRDKDTIQKQLDTIEEEMSSPNFWSDKDTAQKKVQEYNDLKLELEGVGK